MSGHDRRPARGFSLIELLMACAVAAVLLSLAGGSLQRALQVRALAAQTSELAQALRFAASEAFKRAEFVTLCARGGTADAPQCAGSASSGWQSGWIVFVDRGERAVVEPGDQILRLHEPLEHSGGVEGTLRAITFGANGISVNAASHFLFRPVGVAPGPAQDALSQLVCVAKPGRPRILALGVVACAA